MLHDIDLIKRLEVIRTRFVQRITEWLPGMEAVHDDLEAGICAKRDLMGLLARAHKIAGSARSFGFSDFSSSAARLENLLEATLLADKSLDAIAALLPALHAFLDEARGVAMT
jgi:HPt (histidine-containing phosphotransfer) domain-containing protein